MQYMPAPNLQKEKPSSELIGTGDSEYAECEMGERGKGQRGSEQLKSALFDYYLQKELSRHRESPKENKDSEAEVEQI